MSGRESAARAAFEVWRESDEADPWLRFLAALDVYDAAGTGRSASRVAPAEEQARDAAMFIGAVTGTAETSGYAGPVAVARILSSPAFAEAAYAAACRTLAACGGDSIRQGRVEESRAVLADWHDSRSPEA